MTLKTSDLRAALARVSTVTKHRTTLPILSCVKLDAASGQFAVSTTNIDEWTWQPVPGDGVIDPCCVPYQRLSNMLAFAGDEVDLSLKGDLLSIKGRGLASVKTLPASEFPEWPGQNTWKIGVNGEDLAACIDSVAWAAMEDSLENYVLQGVHVVCGPRAIMAEATNRKAYAQMKRAAIAAEAEFVVPTPFVARFCGALKLPGAILQLGPKYAQVHGNGSYYCKLTEEKYMDCSYPLRAKRDELGTLEPKDWIDTLKAAQSMQMDDELWRSGFITDTTFSFTNGRGETLTAPLPSKLKPMKPTKINIEHWLKALPHYGDSRATMSESDNALILSNGELTTLFLKFNK